ncbi:hypothetical protein AgCh_009238 [Apium graveolens]
MNYKFEMSNLGKLSYYLGIEVAQGNGYIKLKQTGYAKKLLVNSGMSGCNPMKFPMAPKEKLHKDKQGDVVNATDYKSIVGGIRYLVHTRPDVAFVVGVVSRFMERPTVLHSNAVKRILRYVQGTLSYGLVYTKTSGNNILTAFTDSDLVGHLDDRKSTGEIWGPDANEFNPARYVEPPMHLGAYFPFGLGGRICIGRNLAMAEAKIILATIIKQFSFIVSPSYVHAPMMLVMVQPQYGAHVLVRKISPS